METIPILSSATHVDGLGRYCGSYSVARRVGVRTTKTCLRGWPYVVGFCRNFATTASCQSRYWIGLFHPKLQATRQCTGQWNIRVCRHWHWRSHSSPTNRWKRKRSSLSRSFLCGRNRIGGSTGLRSTQNDATIRKSCHYLPNASTGSHFYFGVCTHSQTVD